MHTRLCIILLNDLGSNMLLEIILEIDILYTTLNIFFLNETENWNLKRIFMLRLLATNSGPLASGKQRNQFTNAPRKNILKCIWVNISIKLRLNKHSTRIYWIFWKNKFKNSISSFKCIIKIIKILPIRVVNGEIAF